MKFISSGHCTIKGPNYDPGAAGVNGRTEAAENLKMRNAVLCILRAKGYTDIISDADGESLGEYLRRIKPGNASVVLEFHFNAYNGKTRGTEAITQMDADKFDFNFSKELADASANIMKIPNRGVKKEDQTHRGRLGLMREQGIVSLLEICFIDNAEDMAAYDRSFSELAQAYAEIVIKYDALF